MKLLRLFLTGIGSNLIVLFGIMLLPAFLVTDHVDIFDKVVSYISEE